MPLTCGHVFVCMYIHALAVNLLFCLPEHTCWSVVGWRAFVWVAMIMRKQSPTAQYNIQLSALPFPAQVHCSKLSSTIAS